MRRAVRVAVAVAALLGALTMSVGLSSAAPLAQAPTPALSTASAGPAAKASPMPRIDYPILIGLAVLGAGIALLTVTVIRRWDRSHYPERELHSPHGPPRH